MSRRNTSKKNSALRFTTTKAFFCEGARRGTVFDFSFPITLSLSLIYSKLVVNHHEAMENLQTERKYETGTLDATLTGYKDEIEALRSESEGRKVMIEALQSESETFMVLKK